MCTRSAKPFVSIKQHVFHDEASARSKGACATNFLRSQTSYAAKGLRQARPSSFRSLGAGWAADEGLVTKRGLAIRKMARPTGVEPVTFGFGNQHSIQLSYGRMRDHFIARRKGASSGGWGPLSLQGIILDCLRHVGHEPRGRKSHRIRSWNP